MNKTIAINFNDTQSKSRIERIFIMRHGYSMGNHDPDNYPKFGDPSVPLHDTGHLQAARAGRFMAAYLKKNPGTSHGRPVIWTSPFKRTIETTSGLIYGADGALSDCRVKESILLIEQSHGMFSHMHERAEQLKKEPHLAQYHNELLKEFRLLAQKPMGDSPLDTYMHASSFFNTVHRDLDKNGESDLFCVTHGVTSRSLIMRFLNLPPRAYDHFKNPGNTDIFVMERDDTGSVSCHKIFDGEAGVSVNIDIKALLLDKAPRLSMETLPEFPKHLRSLDGKKSKNTP